MKTCEDILLDDNWTDLKWDCWYWKLKNGLANTFQLHGINFCQFSKTNSNIIKILCSFSWWRFVKKICLLREFVFIFTICSVLSKPWLFREVAFHFLIHFRYVLFSQNYVLFRERLPPSDVRCPLATCTSVATADLRPINGLINLQVITLNFIFTLPLKLSQIKSVT